MIDLIGNIFAIILGLYSSILHKKLAQSAAKWQDKLFHVKYDEPTTKWVGMSFFVLGIVFIIIGSLNLLRVLK